MNKTFLIKNESVPAHMAFLSGGKWLGVRFARKFGEDEAREIVRHLRSGPNGDSAGNRFVAVPMHPFGG
jgi:hypothetical protein